MQNISLRIEENSLKKIKELEKQEHVDRSSVMRKVIEKGINEIYLEKAVEKYLRSEISEWAAAKFAGVSLRKMQDAFTLRGIDLQYSNKSFKEDTS